MKKWKVPQVYELDINETAWLDDLFDDDDFDLDLDFDLDDWLPGCGGCHKPGHKPGHRPGGGTGSAIDDLS